MSDLFLNEDVRRVLRGKHVVLLGDSNVRGIYKDIVWLLNDNSFIPYECLGAKGEARFPDFSNWKSGNKKISNRLRSVFGGDNRDRLLKFNGLHSGRGYIEPRHYYSETENIHLHYVFITRVWGKEIDDWLTTFEDRNDGSKIDVLIMSSCLWDFNRWGPFGVKEYKENVNKLLKKVKECVNSQETFLWLTALPTSKELNSKAMQVPGLEFQCLTSRYNVVQSNFYTAHKVADHGFHVVDLHYYSLIQSYRRSHDGIHWSPEANRGFTNLILTYLCLITKQTLPGRVPENISLEKIKLMAKVASQDKESDADIVDAKAVQQKLSELTQLAEKLTPKQMQILSELKKIDLTPCPPKHNMKRMHPYDNSNRARPPRGRGLGRGQGNSRPNPQEGFGQIINNRSQALPVWKESRVPWGPGHVEPTQQEPPQIEPWGRGQNQRNSWEPGPQTNQSEHWQDTNQGVSWGPNQKEAWNSDSGQTGSWGSNQGQGFGQDFGLGPIPTSLEFPPQPSVQRQQQQLPPDVGHRMNFAPATTTSSDAHFINPMFRHIVSDGNRGQGEPVGSGFGGVTRLNNPEPLMDGRAGPGPYQRLGGYGESGLGGQSGPGPIRGQGGFGTSGYGAQEGPGSFMGGRGGFGGQPEGSGFFMQGRQDDYGTYESQGGFRGRGNYGGPGSFSNRGSYFGEVGPGSSGSFVGNSSNRSFADDEESSGFVSPENSSFNFGRPQQPPRPNFEDSNNVQFSTIAELQRAKQQQQQFEQQRQQQQFEQQQLQQQQFSLQRGGGWSRGNNY